MPVRHTKEDKMEVKAINCPNCGSNNVVMDSETSTRCKNCNSKFSIEKNEPDKTVVVSNTIVVDDSCKSRVSLLNLAAKDVTDETQFLRRSLIELSINGNVPSDIYEADFEPVKTETDCFLVVKANVDVSYNASVGYDRKVTEQVYDRVAKEYKTKTKTVTDWTPYSGRATYDKTGEAVLRTSAEDELQHIFDFKAVEEGAQLVPFEESSLTQQPETPTSDDYAYAKNEAAIGAKEACKRDMPGDHVRDFSASTVCNVYETAVISANDRILNFNYKGETSQIRGFAGIDEVRQISVPSDNKNVWTHVKSKQKPFEIAAMALYAFNIFLSLLMLGLGSTPSVPRGTKVGVLLPFTLIGIAYFVFFVLYRRKLVKDYSAAMQKAKIEALEKILCDKKLEPLSFEEKNDLVATNSTERSVKSVSAPNKAIFVLFGLATLISLIFMFF